MELRSRWASGEFWGNQHPIAMRGTRHEDQTYFAIYCFAYSNIQYITIQQFPESSSRETRAVGNLETTGQIVMQTKVFGQDQDLW